MTTTNFFYLDVGCTNAALTQSGGLTTSTDVLLGASTAGVYTHINPTVSMSYCPITNTLIEAAIDGASNGGAVVFGGGSCTACMTVDLGSTTNAVETVTFKIRSTLGSG